MIETEEHIPIIDALPILLTLKENQDISSKLLLILVNTLSNIKTHNNYWYGNKEYTNLINKEDVTDNYAVHTIELPNPGWFHARTEYPSFKGTETIPISEKPAFPSQQMTYTKKDKYESKYHQWEQKEWVILRGAH